MTLKEWADELDPRHKARKEFYRELEINQMALSELKILRDHVKMLELRIEQFKKVQRLDAEAIKDADQRWLEQVEETRRVSAMNKSIP